MASSIYKWFILLLFPAILSFIEAKPSLDQLFPLGRDRGIHPFHVSVVEINHNSTDKTLEISCKLFTDDFEKVLAQNYKVKVDLINPPDRKAMDKLVSDYIKTHLSITANGKPVIFSYLGFEKEDDAVFGYVQVDNIPSINKIELVNKLLYDLFTDQINLMHVIVGGNRKSTKLDYPETQAVFTF